MLKRVPGRWNFTYQRPLEVLDRRLRAGQRVLDVGCGLGFMSLYAASRGAQVLGVDVSQRAVSACRQSAHNLGLAQRARFQACDFTKGEVEGSFDLVMCFEVLEHLVDDGLALSRLAALLAPGGVVALSVPSPRSPIHRRRMKREGRDIFDEQQGHLRRYTAEDITGLVESAGLRVEQVRRTEGLLRGLLFVTPTGRFLIRFVRGPLVWVTTVLDNLLVGPLGEAQVMVVARRPAEAEAPHAAPPHREG